MENGDACVKFVTNSGSIKEVHSFIDDMMMLSGEVFLECESDCSIAFTIIFGGIVSASCHAPSGARILVTPFSNGSKLSFRCRWVSGGEDDGSILVSGPHDEASDIGDYDAKGLFEWGDDT